MTLDNLTPRQSSLPTLRRLRAVSVSLVFAAALATAGCSLPTAGSPAPAPSLPSASAEAATDPATPAQPPTAEQAFADRVQTSLDKLSATTKAPNRDQMMAAMLEAGAVQEKVEVSIDITPTGLAVDAIEAASPVESACVIGQVRDGKAAVTILPILASGRCFVGDQH
ncbi:hypothetical protein [Arthrobacter sp. GMC3]|uniref:DUF6993 domain-containing protein n=1 Tax=Arthrobacter sp. GMC3 TaxID=2058894 RepID=UPI002157532D|nr:hypothetical protein [Arthrobacter sp. GMC3]